MFKCRDSGFPGTLVYLAGKDEQGKSIQFEADGSRHIHKTKEQQQQQSEQQQSQQEGSTTLVTTEPTTTSMKIINAKLDRIIALLESQ